MKLVFFDIECANCFQGKGKICSFGYVITDENFNILEKNDIIINPNSKFNLGPDLKLAYSVQDFKKSSLFPVYYDEIETILTDDDCFVFGFSVNNDARYVRDECIRYNLPSINYTFYDVQKMYMLFLKTKNQPSLIGLCNSYNIKASQSIHKSDEDAYMTMLLLKNFVAVSEKNIIDIINEYPGCIGISQDNEVKWKEAEQQSTKGKKKNQTVNYFKKKYVFSYYNSINYKKSVKLSEKKIFISNEYFGLNLLSLKRLVYNIKVNGGILSKKESESDIIISEKPDNYNVFESAASNYKIFNLESFYYYYQL